MYSSAAASLGAPGLAVDQAACARIEEHLSRCRNCAAACDSLKRTVSFCKQIPGDQVPAPVRSAIRSALLTATR